VQQPRWRPAAEKRARRYTFDRHALPSRGRTHAPATDVLRIAAAPTATEAIHRTGAPQERAQASGRRSRPRPSGSAMSAGSAPGAVPLSACGSILRTTNVHLRLPVVEMNVNAVPAPARADHGDRDEDCARPTNQPHGALLKFGDVPDEQLASAVRPRLQPPSSLVMNSRILRKLGWGRRHAARFVRVTA